MAQAIALVESKRDSDGRWPLDQQHAGTMPVEFGDGVGQPSRWNTLRAMRVLRWYDEGQHSTSSASGTGGGVRPGG